MNAERSPICNGPLPNYGASHPQVARYSDSLPVKYLHYDEKVGKTLGLMSVGIKLCTPHKTGCYRRAACLIKSAPELRHQTSSYGSLYDTTNRTFTAIYYAFVDAGA